ncbi:uncharacterized protein B0H64DRAFT_431284 [Chaetomium fimeti]|uniref:Ecp2 effector protein domain-containing protein n=1 Tax=Chaetomium fimeti TaxID=1854472 RepID=A0AAE0LUH9_9PEZI|nr:hypothetical protein B0H64DRAFT_431284 [Chaetomium fimeti]
MIFIIPFLVLLFQVAHCGPLAEPRTFCDNGIADDLPPVESECRQVIDAFNHHDSTGYITVEGNTSLVISRGRCTGGLTNVSGSTYAVNADALTIIMKNYIFDRCILNKQWGFYATNKYTIQLVSVLFEDYFEDGEQEP